MDGLAIKMKKYKLNNIVFLVLVLTIGFLFAEESLENPDNFIAKSNRIISTDRPLDIENFNLYSYSDYKMVSLNQYSGKVILLEFWTTWYRHCLQEIQPLNELHDKYSKKGLVILAVYVDEKEGLKQFMKMNSDIKYNVLLGSEGMARDYNLSGLPYIYLLDREMRVKKKFSGYVDRRTLEKEIRKLL